MELKNSIEEIKNEIVGLGNKADQMEERISDVYHGNRNDTETRKET